MNIYLDTFFTFAKIGAFTLGGGYAMLPLIEEEVVNKKKWIQNEEFIDLVAIAQSAPGVFAVNISIFIGYRLRRVKGAVTATLGSVLPSFLIILLIALFFQEFKDNQVVERIFRGIRPAVVALIAAPTFRMAKTAKIGLNTLWIPIVSALLIWQLGVSPIYIIIAAGLGGYIYGRFYAGQEEEQGKSPEDKERERKLAEANKEARRKEKEYKKLQEKLEKSRREQEEAQRKAEQAKRKEAEALQMIPQAREEAQKAHQEAQRRKEEDRRIRAEQPSLFDVIDPRKVAEDNDPNNDNEDEDEEF